MKKIEEIDKNLKVVQACDGGMVYHNVLEPPFSLYGVFYEDGKFVRMPAAVAATVNEGVAGLFDNTAGGRVRFSTDSRKISIRVGWRDTGFMHHMSVVGQAGFDLYVDCGEGEVFYKSFIPPADTKGGYTSQIIDVWMKGNRTFTVNFPLYHNVSSLEIGLEADASLGEPTPYKDVLPMVYYGSSITQGGCASRPGNSYQGFISRHYNVDYINLGFSGSARGEEKIARYIASLDMSLFVLDYDHNTPSYEHLVATHEPFFRIIREAHPTMPIIIMSRPAMYSYVDDLKTREGVIKKTYLNAREAGDENVYFIDGKELYEICGAEGTVDGTHPTDLGFFSMAERLIKEIDKFM